MDVLLSVPVDLERLADLLLSTKLRPRPQPHRDLSSWHVTNLLESAQRIMKGDHAYHEGVSVPSGIMSLGRIWEFVADVWLDDYARSCGGLYLSDVVSFDDGVAASFDGVIYLPDVSSSVIVAETKLRFSVSTAIPERHLRQMMCYCHCLGTCLVAYTVLRVSSAPPSAQAELVIGRFTPSQVAETWQSILKTKEYLESLGIQPSVPVRG